MPSREPSLVKGRNARVYLLVSSEKLFRRLQIAYGVANLQAWATDVFAEVFRIEPRKATLILSGQIKVEFDVTGRMFYNS